MSRRLGLWRRRWSVAALAAGLLALAAAGTADAAVGPSVSTGSATGVTATSATLNGTVNPNGSATSWHFEYGTTTAYGQTTPAQNAGSGTSNLGVSATVASLQAGKTYHFRIVATSTGGTSAGADATFSTPAPGASPPAVTTSPATGITGNGAKLNGKVNPNGAATTWFFEYGTTTGYGTKTPVKNAGNGTKASNVNATVGGLSASTTYHYRLVATNPSGTTDGADQTFTTSGPPVVQTGPVQTVTTTTAVLTGTVNPLGHPTTWHFEYGPTISYGTNTPNQKAAGGSTAVSVSTTIANLTPGTVYHYRLVATSNVGTSAGADATFASVAPLTLVASAHGVVYGGAVRLSGVVAGDKAGVTVTVLARRFGVASFATSRTALTVAGGKWSVVVRPAIFTTYEASANGATSTAVTVGVRPHVSLRVHGTTISTSVRAARSFKGRRVVLQRLAHGSWHAVAIKRLGRGSATTFSTVHLPHGRTTIRVTISTSQAGAGYLGSISPRRIVHR
jgi:hypothetical protein